MIRYTPKVYYKKGTRNLVLTKTGAAEIDNTPRRGYIIRDVENIICPGGEIVKIKNYMLPQIMRNLTVVGGAFTDEIAWGYDEGSKTWLLLSKDQIQQDKEKSKTPIRDLVVGDKFELADGTIAYVYSDMMYISSIGWNDEVLSQYSGRVICIDVEKHDWQIRAKRRRIEAAVIGTKFNKDLVYRLEQGIDVTLFEPTALTIRPDRPLNGMRWHCMTSDKYIMLPYPHTIKIDVLPFDEQMKQKIFSDADTLLTQPARHWMGAKPGEVRAGLREFATAFNAAFPNNGASSKFFTTGEPTIQLTTPDGKKYYGDRFSHLAYISKSPTMCGAIQLTPTGNEGVTIDYSVFAKEWKYNRPSVDIVLLKGTPVKTETENGVS